MPKLTNIASIYDYPGAVTVFRRSEREVAVSLGAKCLILCPNEWNHGGIVHPFSGASESTVRSWLSIVPESEAVVSFGTLLTWASRRPNAKVTRYVYDAEAEGEVPQTTRPLYNAQSVGGYPFDRFLIREVLQTFVEAECPADWRFEQRLFPGGAGRILSIAGYEITAFVMSLRLDAERGNDPMPGEWSRPVASKETG